jgi:hypothetical protein
MTRGGLRVLSRRHSELDYIATDDVSDELERIWKEMVAVYSRYYPRIWLEGFRGTMKISKQDSGCVVEIRTLHLLNGRQELRQSPTCFSETSLTACTLHSVTTKIINP